MICRAIFTVTAKNVFYAALLKNRLITGCVYAGNIFYVGGGAARPVRGEHSEEVVSRVSDVPLTLLGSLLLVYIQSLFVLCLVSRQLLRRLGQPLTFRLVVIVWVVGFGGFLICRRPLIDDPLERRIGFYKSSRRFVIERRFFLSSE